MTRNEKYDRRRRRERRDFLRGFPLTLFDGPGLAVKLPICGVSIPWALCGCGTNR